MKSIRKPLTYDFNGHVAFVTGAGNGIGEAAARAFAAAGAAVGVVDQDAAAAGRVVSEIEATGQKALTVECDVTDEIQVKHAVNATVEAFGRLDMAFNNAGIMLPPVDSAAEEADSFDRIVAVNLRGVWASMKYELQQMREQESGAIVNCSSLGGLVGGDGRATYHATKHGVIGQTKSVAIQYGPHNVRVNAVRPGTIATPMVDRMTAGGELDTDAVVKGVPLRRLGQAEEIAAAAVWLCSDAASFVTGAALPVDGGVTA
ncbi:Short-chain dehydrogenase/reductase [Corynebacterium glyciniphilum AJ 3170]|uniref:Short-chain dehydrogenase/reductase n=1 Tax=Corynebacterium glyciniphilum AJ 3170 TaxID=1404245 RepID=X5EAI5_9CORY|nr:glucose 1-dehydrogenase [Corynebacterium glyciniphilum]AHW63661.1 Short-chain dehydrogenase/reductase [Corynebacterium glyciniphilum AJ 3170]